MRFESYFAIAVPIIAALIAIIYYRAISRMSDQCRQTWYVLNALRNEAAETKKQLVLMRGSLNDIEAEQLDHFDAIMCMPEAIKEYDEELRNMLRLMDTGEAARPAQAADAGK